MTGTLASSTTLSLFHPLLLVRPLRQSARHTSHSPSEFPSSHVHSSTDTTFALSSAVTNQSHTRHGSPTTPHSSVFTVGSSQPADSDTDAAHLDSTSERAGMNWVQEKVGVCVEAGRKEGFGSSFPFSASLSITNSVNRSRPSVENNRRTQPRKTWHSGRA